MKKVDVYDAGRACRHLSIEELVALGSRNRYFLSRERMFGEWALQEKVKDLTHKGNGEEIRAAQKELEDFRMKKIYADLHQAEMEVTIAEGQLLNNFNGWANMIYIALAVAACYFWELTGAIIGTIVAAFLAANNFENNRTSAVDELQKAKEQLKKARMYVPVKAHSL